MSALRYHTAPRPLKRPVKGRTHTLKSHPWTPVREGEPGYDTAPFERRSYGGSVVFEYKDGKYVRKNDP